MARNLENSTSGNFNIQEMGPHRSTRLNMTTGETAPPLPQGSTMGTTAVATTAITRGKVHGSTTTAQAVLSKAHATRAMTRAMPLHAQREPNALPIRAQASHSLASRTEQPTLVAQPAPAALPALVEQPTLAALPALAEQPTLVAQTAPAALPALAEQPTLAALPAPAALPALTEQPTFVAQPAPAAHPAPAEQFTLVAQSAPAAQPASVALQAAQIDLRLFRPSGPTIEPGAFSPRFTTNLTYPNSNLAPGAYRTSIAQGGTFLPSSSSTNGEQYLTRQVIELTSALAQQTTLVNQLLQRTEIQRAPDEVSRSRTRVDEPLHQRPGKRPINQPRSERSGSLRYRLDPWDSEYSRLSARRSVHSRSSPWTSIRSRVRSHSNYQHGQPSRQSVHSQLGSQGVFSTSHRSRQHGKRREAVTQSDSSSTGSLRATRSPAMNMLHAPQPRHRRVERREERPKPIGHDQGQPRAPLPQQRQIQEEVERLFNERLPDFRRSKVADEALRRDMTNISRSPFTDEVEQTEPPRKFSMPHFTSFKGDEDPERHLKHYRSAMVLYGNNDALMCKIFAITLQGEAQDWFHTLPARSIRNFDDLSLIFTKEYSSYRSIKKKSDHLFSIVKDPWETIRDYVKRFKAEKAKIVGCNEDIATAAFRNGFPIEHPLFGKLIMEEELTLAASYALAEKHALWDEAKQSNKNESEKNHMERSPTREDLALETFPKFTVPIGQILRQLKNEPWFELPPPIKGNLTKLDHTKYCAFHQGPGHTTNDCLKWKQYLEKLTNEGRCEEYLDRSTKRPTQAGEVPITP